MKSPKKHTFLEAKKKIEAWCAYRERCHSEVTQKLFDYGLDMEDTDALLAHLIEYNFLNEQRFADSFVSGKFKLKKWGKVKIKNHLKQKKVPEICIKTALKNEIEDVNYLQTLTELAQKKWNQKKGSTYEKKVKVMRYLSGKGFETDLIYSTMDNIISTE